MHLRIATYILGWILLFYSLAMLPSAAVGWFFQSGGITAVLLAMAVTAAAGLLCILIHSKSDEIDLHPREGFFIVALGWFLCSIFGGLPFLFDNTFVSADQPLSIFLLFRSFTDSVFESASGLTTTGASVLQDFNQPHAIMFWRSTNHWLGGMGIIVLSLAILPLIGAGGMQLFKAEVPGPVTDRLKPRIQDTAMTLSKVYVLLTIAQTVVLMFCGMNLYEALCHTFGTVATGGFSTNSQSVGGYDSPIINYVIVFFMILAGANFALHYRFLKGEYSIYLKNGEFRVYLLLIAIATATLTWLAYTSSSVDSIPGAFEHALFQTVSIMTTTGYATADFEQWPQAAQLILFYLMFIGGCAGSTGGGIKVIRIVLLSKFAYREMYRLIYPTSVVMIKQDGKTVSDRVTDGILGFFILVAVTFISCTIFLSILGLDFITSLSATAACLFNIGPGLGDVGPYDNYANIPILAKWCLSFSMIVGRLEVYSVLILTAPEFWRK